MGSVEKRFTISEANELLPSLAPVLTELTMKFERALDVQKKIAAGAVTNGGTAERDRWNKLLARVQELIERVHGWGLEIRDVEEGLVDFPAEIDGGPAFLCWKLGEDRVMFWHRPDEGFAGRKPL